MNPSQFDNVAPALLVTLDLAVPLAIHEVASWSQEQRLAYCHENTEVIASRSDDLMFGSKKKGEVAALFAILARSLACMAYMPGGVKFGGRHWEASFE